MIKSIAVAVIILAGAGFLSANYIGYTTAGKQYISQTREKRKSVRAGSGIYARPMYGSSRSYRGGK
jgi:hypothetical protein